MPTQSRPTQMKWKSYVCVLCVCVMRAAGKWEHVSTGTAPTLLWPLVTTQELRSKVTRHSGFVRLAENLATILKTNKSCLRHTSSPRPINLQNLAVQGMAQGPATSASPGSFWKCRIYFFFFF